jgi:hypothetical protein
MVNNTTRYFAADAQVHLKGYHDDPSLDRAIEAGARVLEQVRAEQAVAAATVRLETTVLASRADRSRGIVAFGVDPAQEARVTDLFKAVVDGRGFSGDDDTGVLIGEGLAEALVLRAGDEMVLVGQAYDGSIASARVPVRGVFRTKIDDLDGYVAVMPMAGMRDFLAAPEAVTAIALRLRDRGALDGAVQALSARVGAEHEVVAWPVLLPMVAVSIRFHEVMGFVVLAISHVRQRLARDGRDKPVRLRPPASRPPDFTDRDWPAEKPPCKLRPRFELPGGTPVLPGMSTEKAEQVCRLVKHDGLHKDCVFDVATTGDAVFARGYELAEQLRDRGTSVQVHADRPRSKWGERVLVIGCVGPLVSTSREHELKAPPRPHGNVQFIVDGAAFGKPAPLCGRGRATMLLPSLAPGEHRLRATYAGDEHHDPISSASLIHVVEREPADDQPPEYKRMPRPPCPHRSRQRYPRGRPRCQDGSPHAGLGQRRESTRGPAPAAGRAHPSACRVPQAWFPVRSSTGRWHARRYPGLNLLPGGEVFYTPTGWHSGGCSGAADYPPAKPSGYYTFQTMSRPSRRPGPT